MERELLARIAQVRKCIRPSGDFGSKLTSYGARSMDTFSLPQNHKALFPVLQRWTLSIYVSDLSVEFAHTSTKLHDDFTIGADYGHSFGVGSGAITYSAGILRWMLCLCCFSGVLQRILWRLAKTCKLQVFANVLQVAMQDIS